MKRAFAILLGGSLLACTAHAQQPAYPPSGYSGANGAQPAAPMPAQNGAAMPPEMQGMMHQAASNQLGILEYCQANHYADQSVIDLQRRQIAAMPVTQGPNYAQAESEGRQGVVEAGGQRVTLADAAAKEGSTVADLCGRIGDMVRQGAMPPE